MGSPRGYDRQFKIKVLDRFSGCGMKQELIVVLFVIGSFFLSTSCKFNPNLQGEGRTDLQGLWEEKQVAYQGQRLQFQQHQLTFTCDSVYLVIRTQSRVKTYADSCSADGKWTEYAKGVYHTAGDTLMIDATFTKPNFKQKISGCFRVGQYRPSYLIRQTGGDSLKLESLLDHLSLTLHLREKIICKPKPLN